MKSPSATGQGYLDLVKASWILIDVIRRHPQLNLLNTGIRYEVELLAEVSYHIPATISQRVLIITRL